jgi:hypothetical protein
MKSRDPLSFNRKVLVPVAFAVIGGMMTCQGGDDFVARAGRTHGLFDLVLGLIFVLGAVSFGFRHKNERIGDT